MHGVSTIQYHSTCVVSEQNSMISSMLGRSNFITGVVNININDKVRLWAPLVRLK